MLFSNINTSNQLAFHWFLLLFNNILLESLSLSPSNSKSEHFFSETTKWQNNFSFFFHNLPSGLKKSTSTILQTPFDVGKQFTTKKCISSPIPTPFHVGNNLQKNMHFNLFLKRFFVNNNL